MYIKNATQEEIHEAVVSAGLDCKITPRGKTRFSVRLRMLPGSTKNSAYAKWHKQWNGSVRKSRKYVCIHGHYAFMKYLFRNVPNAEIVSDWYTGAPKPITVGNLDTWYNKLRYTLKYEFQPPIIQYDDECNCQENDYYGIDDLPLEPGNPLTTHERMVEYADQLQHIH